MENNASIKALMKLIQKVCEEFFSRQDSIISGVVDSINVNGTVNLHIPPDNIVFTNIPNQCPFGLSPGDSVKLMKEKGRASNMWVIAKCGVSNEGVTTFLNLAHPVGSYYWSEDPTNPSVLFGGTWVKFDNSSFDGANCWKRTA